VTPLGTGMNEKLYVLWYSASSLLQDIWGCVDIAEHYVPVRAFDKANDKYALDYYLVRERGAGVPGGISVKT
jgi:hypothetical protein